MYNPREQAYINIFINDSLIYRRGGIVSCSMGSLKKLIEKHPPKWCNNDVLSRGGSIFKFFFYELTMLEK